MNLVVVVVKRRQRAAVTMLIEVAGSGQSSYHGQPWNLKDHGGKL